MKQAYIYLYTILLLCSLFGAQSVLAAGLQDQINSQIGAGARGAGIQGAPKDPQEIVVVVIQVFLSILGMFFMVLVVLSGYWYVTAKGDEAKVEKAKSTIQSAILGLAVILMAYSITYFVGRKFSAAVQEGGYTSDLDLEQPGR